MPKLTPKQRRFVEEYLIDLNASQAARRAGYSKKTAHRIGAENLQKPVIQAAIKAALDAASKRAEVTVDDILRELKHISFARLTDVIHWDDDGVRVKTSEALDDSAIATVQSVRFQEVKNEYGTTKTIQVKQYDKLAALEKLARRLGFYNTQPPAAPIKIQIVEATPDFEDDDDLDADD